VAIDPEAIDAHDMGEALLRSMTVGAHDEGPGRDEHHSGHVVVFPRQTGIGGAASKLIARRVFLRQSESANH
jgi:hypothetical protein